MNYIKNNSMKKVFALIAVAAMMLSCGGNGQNGTNEKDVNGSGAKISIGVGVNDKEMLGEVN